MVFGKEVKGPRPCLDALGGQSRYCSGVQYHFYPII